MKINKSAPDFSMVYQLPSTERSWPTGWMSPHDLSVLYSLPQWIKGTRGLEVGPWTGRSTIAIMLGMLASNSGSNLDLVDFGICGEADWFRRFQNRIEDHHDYQYLSSVINSYAGTAGELISNLNLWDLWRFINGFYIGDLRNYSTSSKYDFAFLDVVHDETEMREYLPLISSLMSKNYVIVLDDIVDEEIGKFAASLLGTSSFWLSKDLFPEGKLMVAGNGPAFQKTVK